MVRSHSEASLDPTDLRLIAELESNPRQSYVNLAAMLNVNEITVRRRVDRLLKERLISFRCVLNAAAIGLNWALLGLKVSQGYTELVAKELSRHQSIYLIITSGRYDIMAWVTYKDPAMLYDFIARDLGKIKKIKDIEAWPVLKLMKYSWGLLGDTNHDPFPSRTIRPLDELDRNLLVELHENPRMSNTSLAKKLGISRQTAGARLQRLFDDDVLGIQCSVAHAALGYEFHVGTLIKVRPGSIVDVAERLIASRSVQYLVATSGRYDLAMETIFRDSDEMSHFLMHELGVIPGIESSDTLLHLKALSSPQLSVQSAMVALRELSLLP